MTKLLKILTIVILYVSVVNAEDSFFMQEDKQKHMAAGTVVSLVSSSFYSSQLDFTPAESFWAGVATSLLVGVGKELYDSQKGSTGFDKKDILATGIGGIGGASIVFFVHKF